MTADKRRGGHFRTALLFGTGAGLLHIPAHAGDAPATGAAGPDTVQEVYVFGQRENYKLDAAALPKLSAPPSELPQSIDVISAQELQDRAVTDFNQALHTVPGITIGAGEFRSMGNSPTIRGFSARDDMFLDGIRDYGDYYRDPFNLESIEVLEGPSSILFGRGSTGGVIEQQTKLPRSQAAASVTVTGGTDDTRRATLDVNEPVPALAEGAAVRLNLMGHKAMVADRDAVETSRWGAAPSVAFGLGTPTRVTVAYFYQFNDDIPDYGLPYFGTRPAAVPQQNFYGFRSDYLRTDTGIASLTVQHDWSDAVTLENRVRYANYGRSFRFTEPLIAAAIPLSTPLSAVNVTRNVNSGSSIDTMLWDQLFATARWQIGLVRNTTVVGLEGGHEKAAPLFENSSGVPTTPLLSPNENQAFSATSTFPRYQTHLVANSLAPFIIDTAKAGRWEVTLGLRWDRFRVDYDDVNYSATAHGQIVGTHHIPHLDEMPSYRAALSYALQPNGSLYAAFGTSFNPSAEDLSLISSSRSFSLNNAQLDPEKNRTYEVGTKWELLQQRLEVTGALFRLEKENARVPDPTNLLLNILGGSQRVDGGEVRLQGRLTANWQVIVGYTYLDGKVTKSVKGAAPVGAPLMNTPRNAFTTWTVYQLSDRLELGAGARGVSSQYTQNAPPMKTVPGFWTFDAMVKYAITPRIAAQVSVNNVLNRYYYDQLHFFHVVPGPGRSALLSLSARY